MPQAVEAPIAKGARTRQALLDAAVAHFAAVGERAASVPVIARGVGITPSAVYAHFPSKRALFDAAVDNDVSELILDAVPDLLEGTFDHDFGRVFARLLRALPAHPLARRILSGEEQWGTERLAFLPSEVRLHAGIATALRRGQKDGSVRRDVDVEALSVGLEAIVVALLVSILQTGGVIDPAVSSGVLAVLDASIRPPG